MSLAKGWPFGKITKVLLEKYALTLTDACWELTGSGGTLLTYDYFVNSYLLSIFRVLVLHSVLHVSFNLYNSRCYYSSHFRNE